MKLFNVAAAAVTGGIAALGVGVVFGAPAARADHLPPGTYWCWSHLVPNAVSCPAIAPWGTRWSACPNTKGITYTLDGNMAACGTTNFDPDRLYTMNCWGHDLILGKVCPAIQPAESDFTKCWAMVNPPIYGIYGDCSPLNPL